MTPLSSTKNFKSFGPAEVRLASTKRGKRRIPLEKRNSLSNKNWGKTMDDQGLIIAMGEKGLGVTWPRNKNWTQVNKAKEVANPGKTNPIPENQKIQMQIKRGQNQDVANLPPLG